MVKEWFGLLAVGGRLEVWNDGLVFILTIWAFTDAS